jgi:hypothetical protein
VKVRPCRWAECGGSVRSFSGETRCLLCCRVPGEEPATSTKGERRRPAWTAHSVRGALGAMRTPKRLLCARQTFSCHSSDVPVFELRRKKQAEPFTDPRPHLSQAVPAHGSINLLYRNVLRYLNRVFHFVPSSRSAR